MNLVRTLYNNSYTMVSRTDGYATLSERSKGVVAWYCERRCFSLKIEIEILPSLPTTVFPVSLV